MSKRTDDRDKRFKGPTLSKELKERLGKSGKNVMGVLYGIATAKKGVFDGLPVTAKDKIAASTEYLNRLIGKPLATSIMEVNHYENVSTEELKQQMLRLLNKVVRPEGKPDRPPLPPAQVMDVPFTLNNLNEKECEEHEE